MRKQIASEISAPSHKLLVIIALVVMVIPKWSLAETAQKHPNSLGDMLRPKRKCNEYLEVPRDCSSTASFDQITHRIRLPNCCVCS